MPDQDQLYVKLEGHEDLRNELHSINQIVRNVEEASQILEELRGIKKKTIQNIEDNVIELNQRIEEIYRQMPNVDEQELSANVAPNKPEEAEQIDESVNQLHNQLQTLKKELKELN